MDHSQFFQNRACPYFPCHSGVEPESFNCLFCFCPLYALGDRCGGDFCYTPSGIKDCSGCIRPHIRDHYSVILSDLGKVMELAKKDPERSEIT